MECSIFYEAVVKLEEWTSYPFLQYGHHFIEDKFYCDIHGTQRKHGGRPGMDPNIFVKSSPTAAQPVHIQDSPRAAYHPQVNTARPVSVSPAPSAGSKTVTTHYHTPKTQGILSPGQRGVPTAAFGADLSKSVTYGGGVGPGGTHYDSNRLSPAPSQYSTQSRNQSQQHYQQHVVQAPPPVPSNPPPSNEVFTVFQTHFDQYFSYFDFLPSFPLQQTGNHDGKEIIDQLLS